MKLLSFFAPMALLPLLLLAVPAHAQLDLSLTPSAQTGTAGTTLNFFGILSNPTANSVFLYSENISLAGFATDGSPFIFNAPLNLEPMGTTDGSGSPTDSYTGSFFDVVLDPSVAPGTYQGTLSILGGADPNATDTVATQDFSVTVLPAAIEAVPEASTTLSLGGLLLLGSLAVMQAKMRAKRRTA